MLLRVGAHHHLVLLAACASPRLTPTCPAHTSQSTSEWCPPKKLNTGAQWCASPILHWDQYAVLCTYAGKQLGCDAARLTVKGALGRLGQSELDSTVLLAPAGREGGGSITEPSKPAVQTYHSSRRRVLNRTGGLKASATTQHPLCMGDARLPSMRHLLRLVTQLPWR